MRKILAILLFSIFFCTSIALAESVTVAQGDPVWVAEYSPNGTCWLFPDHGIGDSRFYDIPAQHINNVTWCNIYGTDTANLNPGTYFIVHEAPAMVNGNWFKDISWINGTLTSSLKLGQNIDESGKDASVIMQNLEDTISSDNLNTYSTDTIYLQKPLITITGIDRTATDVYTISGQSNLRDGENLTIYVDDLRYLSQHNTSFIYNANVVKHMNESTGIWSEDMQMDINNMPAGWHTAEVYGGNTYASVRFKIDQQQWLPAATPTEYVKYLSNGDIAPVTIIVTQTPVIEITYVDRWHPATPTPAITDALGGAEDYPYTPGKSVAVPIGVLALVAMGAIVLLRDYRRK